MLCYVAETENNRSTRLSVGGGSDRASCVFSPDEAKWHSSLVTCHVCLTCTTECSFICHPYFRSLNFALDKDIQDVRMGKQEEEKKEEKEIDERRILMNRSALPLTFCISF